MMSKMDSRKPSMEVARAESIYCLPCIKFVPVYSGMIYMLGSPVSLSSIENLYHSFEDLLVVERLAVVHVCFFTLL
jgi:hypothetical protein